MNPEVKKKWVAALRSGKYAQGKDCLRTYNGDNFCCLGVLCDLIDPTGWQPGGRYEYNNESVTHYLPNALRNEVGISIQEQAILGDRNDNWCDFNEIANFIEATL